MEAWSCITACMSGVQPSLSFSLIFISYWTRTRTMRSWPFCAAMWRVESQLSVVGVGGLGADGYVEGVGKLKSVRSCGGRRMRSWLEGRLCGGWGCRLALGGR